MAIQVLLATAAKAATAAKSIAAKAATAAKASGAKTLAKSEVGKGVKAFGKGELKSLQGKHGLSNSSMRALEKVSSKGTPLSVNDGIKFMKNIRPQDHLAVKKILTDRGYMKPEKVAQKVDKVPQKVDKRAALKDFLKKAHTAHQITSAARTDGSPARPVAEMPGFITEALVA